jgi:nucleotide-binding universal stress UspA family protein
MNGSVTSTPSPRIDARPAPAFPLTAFQRVVCGVNGSGESEEATRQARLLAAPVAQIRLVAAVDRWNPIAGAANTTPESLRKRAENLVDTAAEDDDAIEVAVRDGWAASVLQEEAEAWDADLVAVAMHDRGRAAGYLLGRVATDIVARVRCSVLLTRPPTDAEAFPRRIVVGLDGSEPAIAAVLIAEEMARRLEADLHVVVSEGGESIDVNAAREGVLGRPTTVDRRSAVDAIVDACGDDTDLVVVGCRRRSGLGAITSVGAKLAHEVGCSVLLVRGR